MKGKYIVLSILFLGLLALSFYLGTLRGNLETEDRFRTQLEELSEEIKILRQKNQQLSEELTSRGIFSYPQANVVSKMRDSAATVVITLNGKDEIEDLVVERSIISGPGEADWTRHEGSTYFGTLKAHNPAAFNIPVKKDEVGIRLSFKTEEKEWQQYIKLRKTADGKIKSFWVITNGDSQVIDKHIDKGFPVDDEGKVRLWNGLRVNYSDIRMNTTFPG